MILNKKIVAPSEIKYAMIGTTHCINAIVERKAMDKVAVVRIGLPAGSGVPPMSDWPLDLSKAVGNLVYNIKGGFEYDGKEISPLDTNKLINVAKELKKKKIKSIAISGIFSPVKPDHEIEAANIFKEIIGSDITISLSHKLGTLGLIERENATILNASVVSVAKAAADAFENACDERDIEATIYFSQNDGTLMSVDYARNYPILTVSSGPTNSFRGAAFLTGLDDFIVVDVGGTTMLSGVMIKGFPRQSAATVNLAGVRTNFRMPDLVSLGCGGGSIIRSSDNSVNIGPDSLGYNIVNDSIAWGGNIITTTDISLAAGYAQIEDDKLQYSKLKQINKNIINLSVDEIIKKLERSVEMIRTNPDPMPMVLVGGGGLIISPNHYNKIFGISKVVRPENFQSANALGAAIAQVSGEIDMVFALEDTTREDAIKTAKKAAVEESVKAGAKRDTVNIVEIDEIYLSYLPSNAVRVKIKAAGKLDDSK